MVINGIIRKMEASAGEVIQYRLPVGNEKVEMNLLLGHRVQLVFQGSIHCIRCGRQTSKSFAQGYCYPCFISAPETEPCVLRPELCRAHEGEARDMQYAKEHCLIEHVVYLSWTSGLKIGVTRHTQVPTRWIDQGAIQAVELARTPNRYTAGLIESAMKAHLNDRTDWRKMLANPDPPERDLVEEKLRIREKVPRELQNYLTPDRELYQFCYPVLRHPAKPRSFNFDRERELTGLLVGIKGQYLIFEDERVLNIRKFGGYLVTFQSD